MHRKENWRPIGNAMVAMTHKGNRKTSVAISRNIDELPGNEGKKPKKKYARPKKPEDLLTCSSFLARDLVAQYLKMGIISQIDAVALYIVAGIVEFGRKNKSFYESSGSIARALGLQKKSVKTYLKRLKEDGVIVRNGSAGASMKERPWSAPGLAPHSNPHGVSGVHNTTLETDDGDGISSINRSCLAPGLALPSNSEDSKTVSSVVNTTLETEKGDGGNNAYPDRDTPSSPGEETSCSLQGDTPCGPHIRESDKEESEEENHIGKECPKPLSCVSKNSSFKKRSKTQARHLLESFPWDRYQLDSPEGLASCWAHLVEVWRSPSGAEAEDHNGSAAEIDPMENPRAFMTLKQMRIYKNPETVRLWLEWFVKSGGLNKFKYITQFSKSWDDYVIIAARAFVAELRRENAAWNEELEARCRREAGKTMPVIRFNSEFKENEIDEARKRFRASLPGDDVIVEAIRGVETFYRDLSDDGNYMRWLASLAKAVPVLGPYVEVSYADRHRDFIRLAREDCDCDLDLFADQTRDYVADRMKYNRDLTIDQGFVGARMIVFNWLDYAYYFDLAPGIDEVLFPPQDTEDEAPHSQGGEQAS